MTCFRKVSVFFFALSVVILSARDAYTSFVAYSLREAVACARRLETGEELTELGGITRIAGLVYDRDGKDIILVGLAAPHLPKARLDDLVVALRARLAYAEWPLVSIDPVEDTDRTKRQEVRFDGHLEDTPFGRNLLDCDIVLKRYSLQKLAKVAPVRPYNVHVEADIRRRVESAGHKVHRVSWLSPEDGARLTRSSYGSGVLSSDSFQARFCFYAIQPYVTARKDDVFCIKELRLAVESWTTCQGASKFLQTAAERFAREWTEHFDEMCQTYPVLKKLKVLYDLVAVAEAIRTIEHQPYLDYFVEGHPVSAVSTDRSYKLEELYGVVERTDGLRHLLRISGGVEFRTEIEFLNYGDVTPLRSMVIESRPSPNALTWHVPLEGWRMPNARDLGLPSERDGSVPTGAGRINKEGTGCYVSCQSVILDPTLTGDGSAAEGFFGFPGLPALPRLKGVSMTMIVDNGSFKPISADKETLREGFLKSRTDSNTLSWPVPEGQEKNDKN